MSDTTVLFALTIAFSPANTSLRLLFDNEEAAKAAYESLRIPNFEKERNLGLEEPVIDYKVQIADSFGSTATIDRSFVMTYWLTDLAREMEGMKAQELLKAHAMASLQRQASTDPLLRGAMGNSPIVRPQ